MNVKCLRPGAVGKAAACKISRVPLNHELIMVAI
jgi:hypothetical protein